MSLTIIVQNCTYSAKNTGEMIKMMKDDREDFLKAISKSSIAVQRASDNFTIASQLCIVTKHTEMCKFVIELEEQLMKMGESLCDEEVSIFYNIAINYDYVPLKDE